MKQLFFLFYLISISIYAQEEIPASFQQETSFVVNQIVDIDNFGTQYFIDNNTFYKKNQNTTINYSNVQLGNITTANAFNPLKINLFYKDFNTAIILDNRLSEIFKIDFNTIEPYKSISHITTGNDNAIWVFNQDKQQLELYDYKANKTRAETLPIASQVIALKSNYNFCWLLTEEYLYQYNYFGSLIQKIKNSGFLSIEEDNGNLIIQKENELFFLANGTEILQKITTPNLLISQFLLTNETLYIYHNETLGKFQLKNK